MTGSRGPFSKPDHLRQRRNKPAGSLVLVGDGLKPKPREDWLAATKGCWDEYWSSDLASIIRTPQLRMVERLFSRYDERERAYRVISSGSSRNGGGRLVRGSQGQWVQNPLLKYIDACDSEIRQLEDRLGLSPRAMAAVGSGLANAKRSLDDMNRQLETDDAAPDEEVDPREVVGTIGKKAAR